MNKFAKHFALEAEIIAANFKTADKRVPQFEVIIDAAIRKAIEENDLVKNKKSK